MEYYIKTICNKTFFFVQQQCLVTVIISSMIHLNKRKKITRCFKVTLNWYTQFHRLYSHFNSFFRSFVTQVLAEDSYLVVCIFLSFHGCHICRGVARIFQKGGHTVSKWVYSPDCRYGQDIVMAFSPPVVGSLVKKGLQKGGSRTPQEPL